MMNSFCLLLLLIFHNAHTNPSSSPIDHFPACLVVNEVGLQISAVAQTSVNVMFAIGINALPLVQQLRDLVEGIGQTIETIGKYILDAVERLVTSNWLVSYFLGSKLTNYASLVHVALTSMVRNVTHIADHACGLLGNITNSIQVDMINIMQTSFTRMRRTVVDRDRNGTQGQRGIYHLSYANSVALNGMTSLQMFSVKCVEDFRKSVTNGMDLIAKVIELVRWNVENLVELVKSSWHLQLYKIYDLIREGLRENRSLLTSGGGLVRDEFVEKKREFIDCSRHLVENVQLFAEHVNTEIELCLG